MLLVEVAWSLRTVIGCCLFVLGYRWIICEACVSRVEIVLGEGRLESGGFENWGLAGEYSALEAVQATGEFARRWWDVVTSGSG